MGVLKQVSSIFSQLGNNVPSCLETIKKLKKLKEERYNSVINERIARVYQQLMILEPSKALQYQLESLGYLENDIVHNNIGFLYAKEYNYEQSIEHFLRCLKLNQNNKSAHHELIRIYKLTKDSRFNDLVDEAYHRFYNDPEFVNQKALKEFEAGNIEEAIELIIDKNNVNCFLNLGYFYSQLGYIDKSLECTLKAIKFDKTNKPSAIHNFLMDSLYTDKPLNFRGMNDLLDIHGYFAELALKEACKVNTIKSLHKVKVKNIRPRVAILTSGFQNHAIGSFLHFIDETRIDYYVYSNNALEVQFEYRNIKELSTNAIINLVQEDNIDKIIDLDGYTAGNRTDVLFRLSGCIDIELYTFLGYPCDLMIPNVHRVSDRFTERNNRYSVELRSRGPEARVGQSRRSEAMCLFEGCFLNFRPLQEGFPRVHKTIEETRGKVVLGCFCKIQKMSKPVVDSWTRILDHLKAIGIPVVFLVKSGFVTQGFYPEFFNREDVKNLGYTEGYTNYMDRFNLLDCMLDTWPYTSTTVACESLCMNVPILTYCNPDGMHHERVTGSILMESGLDYWIADTVEEYEHKAISYVEHLFTNGDKAFEGVRAEVATPFLEAMGPDARDSYVKKFEKVIGL